MKTHRVLGGGGTQLHVVESGNPSGRPILFIHGFSQCWMAWNRQLHSDLATDYRLIALDLRGHGLSDKPHDGYAESQLWADDIHAVIQQLRLKDPVLCGWSYGPLVILDYIRHYGEDALGGINFIGGVTKLGGEEATALLAPGFLNLIPGFFASDVDECVRSLGSLLDLCFPQTLASEERYLMLGYSVSVPPYVRRALFSRSFTNDDLLPKIRRPVLITQASDDAIVKPAAAQIHGAAIPKAEIHLMPNAGHAAFWNDAPAYNRRLREFVRAARE